MLLSLRELGYIESKWTMFGAVAMKCLPTLETPTVSVDTRNKGCHQTKEGLVGTGSPCMLWLGWSKKQKPVQERFIKAMEEDY